MSLLFIEGIGDVVVKVMDMKLPGGGGERSVLII